MEDPLQHGTSGEAAPAAAGPSTYALRQLNVMTLSSVREKPRSGIFETEFHFDSGKVASVVIHTCLSGNNRQSAHGWLFESPRPDLDRDRPVAELAITSTGEVSVRPGCPADYDVVKACLVNTETIAAQTPTHERVALKSTASIIEAANDAQHLEPTERIRTPKIEMRDSERGANTARRRSWVKASIVALAMLIFAGASVMLVGQKKSSERIDQARTTNAAVPPSAPTSVPLEPALPESRPLRELQADPAFRESYAGLPPPSIERWPALTHEPRREKTSKPSSANAGNAWEKTKRSTSQTPGRTGQRTAIVRAAGAPTQAAGTRQALAERFSTPATGEGATRAPAIVVEEPRVVPRERVALYSSGAERLNKEQQAQCTRGGFIVRAICKERLRWSHCHPDKWDQVPECAVHTSQN